MDVDGGTADKLYRAHDGKIYMRLNGSVKVLDADEVQAWIRAVQTGAYLCTHLSCVFFFNLSSSLVILRLVFLCHRYLTALRYTRRRLRTFNFVRVNV